MSKKTHYKKMKNTNYIGSWDLMNDQGQINDIMVTITGVTKEMVFDGRGGSEECTVIHLKETKPMVANATNLKAIADTTGSVFIEDWNDKQIRLTVKKVKAFGGVHDAIRVVSGVAQQKTKPTLDNQRFSDALTAIADGKFTKERLLNDYLLTDAQKNEAEKLQA